MARQNYLAVLLALFLFAAVPCLYAEEAGKKDLFEMSMEELMEIPIDVSGSLTDASRRLNPATLTTITKDLIYSCGARNLEEVLDIFVPNLEILRDQYEYHPIGLRGINAITDDKYLILVNGREMNEHTQYGALSERDLPMLTDIHHIDVIRGPGSALYGAGAIAMVINIITENATTFEGLEMTTRLGAIEEFYSGEVKYGKKTGEKSGWFLYGGASHYIGADEGQSPVFYATPDLGKLWEDHGWGYAVGDTKQQPRDRMGWRNPKAKVYIDYTDEDFNFWIRYTRGGEHFMSRQPNDAPDQTYGLFYGTGYQQLTAFLGLTREITSELSMDYSFSYDMFDFENFFDGVMSSHREDEYVGKILAKWKPNDRHSVAFGGAISYEQFGKRSPGYPHIEPSEISRQWTYWGTPLQAVMPRWSTYTVSLFGEHQWKINDQWTSFLGGRLDNNTYTRDMYSPRASLVYTPNEKDTFKFMYSRSVRMGHADEMKLAKEVSRSLTTPEKIDTYEIRYERQHSKTLTLAVSGFYNKHDVTGYDFVTYTNLPLGEIRTRGAEAEAIYRTGQTKIILSHGFTQLLNFKEAPDVSSLISAEQHGYGKSLANWYDHVTKLYAQYKLTEKMVLDGSLKVYWGCPGAGDIVRYFDDRYPSTRLAPTDFNLFRPSAFLNLGLSYRVNDNLDCRVDGYNLLGIFDDQANQLLQAFDIYKASRSSAPALAVSMTYRF